MEHSKVFIFYTVDTESITRPWGNAELDLRLWRHCNANWGRLKNIWGLSMMA